MAWIALLIAVVTEILWGLSLKWVPTTARPQLAALVPIVLSFLNMGLLAYAMRSLPAGTAYAIWTGLGSVGVAVGGMFLFQVFMNIFMNVGLLPVMGLTLPFFSYGGTSVLTMFAALGIAAGVRMREKPSWLQ